ncbi:MAG: metalloprotease PmbA [Acidiferrobacterales bacterium]|nr:metalloprotease PmbA [Acidiferrobacterales bacterium]
MSGNGLVSATDGDGVSKYVVQALDYASKLGTDSACAHVGRGKGYELTVRMGELETIEHHNGGELRVTVYMGHKKGSSTTSDFSDEAIAATVQAAKSIAGFTSEDSCNGLAPKDRLASEFSDLDLFHPSDIDRDKALEIAQECESAAMSSDARIINSDGATVETRQVTSAFGNSDGFLHEEQSTSYTVSCCVIGKSDSGMQQDYWYSTGCDPNQLESARSIGLMTAKRTLRRLDSQRINTCDVPVLFEAPIASGLLRCLVGGISGSALYRKASFLLDSIGERIFPEGTRIHEQPHLKRALGSAFADAEGVATVPRDIVSDGVLKGYVLDAYSARKLGMETTANAGGVHNLTIDSGERDFAGMLKLMDTGLLVTGLMGFGVNTVTGNYSQGARGFWVENGEMQYPVEELTVAGNLRDMFGAIVDVGNDVDLRHNIRTGSILISNMAVSGE